MAPKPSGNWRPDGDLVAASRLGDRNAYTDLIHRYAGRVLAVCIGIVGNHADSEDMVQETFMKGFNTIARLRDDERFSTWITQIARNTCRDFLKTGRRRDELLRNRPVPAVAVREDRTGLHEALSRLPERHRLPLALYYLEDRNIGSVAEELGVSEAAAYQRLSRARRALRIILEEVDGR